MPSTEAQNPQSKIEFQKSATVSFSEKFLKGAQKTEPMSLASIYKVPEELRKLKESAYTPRLVSIGPYHSKDPHLIISPTKDTKMSYANSLLGRVSGSSGRVEEVLRKCVDEMQKALEEARRLYAGEVKHELDEEMLVIDGCFVLELLHRWHIHNTHEKSSAETDKKSSSQNPASKEQSSCQNPVSKEQSSNDPILGSILIHLNVQHDLLLLENQLPYFVLEKLFNVTLKCIPSCSLSLVDYVLFFFSNIINFEASSTEPVGDQNSIKESVNYHHILHILHKHYLFQNLETQSQNRSYFEHMLSASKLEFAGIKFKSGTPAQKSPVDFLEPRGLCWPFSRATFTIPRLYIYDSTEPLLRNLIALEQCCPGVPSYFTSYAFLMDLLINSEKDVEVLAKAKVLRNYLGTDEEASDLFNKLCTEVVLGEFHFAKTCTRATKYSELCWPKSMFHLRRRYFATPWRFIGFCVALLAFVISVVEFIRSFL